MDNWPVDLDPELHTKGATSVRSPDAPPQGARSAQLQGNLCSQRPSATKDEQIKPVFQKLSLLKSRGLLSSFCSPFARYMDCSQNVLSEPNEESVC